MLFLNLFMFSTVCTVSLHSFLSSGSTLDKLFTQGSDSSTKKNPPANAGDARDVGSIPGPGRSLGGGPGNPLCILAWRIPWTEEPGRLQSMRAHRVGRGYLACTGPEG